MVNRSSQRTRVVCIITADVAPFKDHVVPLGLLEEVGHLQPWRPRSDDAVVALGSSGVRTCLLPVFRMEGLGKAEDDQDQEAAASRLWGQ